MAINKEHYFIGHAHLDPAWTWRWQEGSCVIKATVRSALDRMKEYPDFTFMLPTAMHFGWIEEFAPEMFEEVKQRVEESRLLLVGGTYVEPDENIPSGEGLARQFLYAQRYYKEKFGKTVNMGFNPDAFGHNAMMPQILKKSGITTYTFMRPEPWEYDGKDFGSNLFRWISPDGSEVTAFRSIGYGNEGDFFMADAKELEEKIEFKESHSTPEIKQSIFFYGVGNHGGGPTKKNIESIYSLQKAYPDKKLEFSSLQKFYDAVGREGYSLPVRYGEFMDWAKGCYSAVSEIKQNIRRCEEGLIAAEKYAIMGKAMIGRKMPTPREFETAWRKLLFMHFHDVSCGTCLRQVYKDFANIAGAVIDFTDTVENSVQQSVSWKIDTRDSSKGTPIVVFNPHSFEVKAPVTVNLQSDYMTDKDGNFISSQRIWSAKRHNLSKGDDTLFMATVPPLGYTTYYIKEDEAKKEYESAVRGEGLKIENERLRVEFDFWSGQIKSMYDKKYDRELLNGKGAVPMVMDDTAGNTWGHGILRFNKLVGQFADPNITLLESGPVRATIRVESFYGKSKLTQYFSLCEGSEKLDVRVALDWHEKMKALKLAFPVNEENAKSVCDVPYGTAERDTNGIEVPMQKWAAIKGEKYGVAVLNDAKYSYSAQDSTMYLTVLRSPIYCDQSRRREDPDAEITDQGLQEFNYSVMPFEGDCCEVNRQAIILNKGLTNLIENNHEGSLPETLSTIACNASNVIVTALKRSEDNSGIVIRITEKAGKNCSVTVSGMAVPQPLNAELTAWSTDTYLLRDSDTVWKKVLLTEFDIEE